MPEPDIGGDVARYLDASRDAYSRGSLEYFARICLEVALTAHREGNYGIGAVAVHFEEGRVREYRGGNRMVTDSGIIDHAETRALLRITRNETPDAEYSFDFGPSDGLWVFGTLEPCPMCACVMTNAGATRSISTIEDGRLHVEDGYQVSDGAANVIGDKFNTQPAIWRGIQRGRGLEFHILPTADVQLQSLSRRIFEETRAQTDQKLTDRTHIGHAASVGESYRRRSLHPGSLRA